MAVPLSLYDVDRLLAEPTPGVRAELAARIASGLAEPGLLPAEIQLAQDIIRILARDVEAAVRARVAETLRHSPHLPRDTAHKLANDIDLVALPLLADSLVLTDEDLVDIIRRGSPGKHETIAGRFQLPELVSDALINFADAPAIEVLIDNHTARIAETSLNVAITRFARSDVIKRAIVLRPGLPITIAERLVSMVSKELQGHLVGAHALSPEIASDILLRAREDAIIHLSMGSTEAELTRMVAQMHQNQRLTPTLMLRALCTGDIAFFEAAMALKADVPIANAQILIHESSRRGLAALYRKAAMPDYLFEVVRTAVDVVDETGFDGNARDLERFRARVISRVLTLTNCIDSTDSEYLVSKLGDILQSAPRSIDASSAPPL